MICFCVFGSEEAERKLSEIIGFLQRISEMGGVMQEEGRESVSDVVWCQQQRIQKRGGLRQIQVFCFCFEQTGNKLEVRQIRLQH